MATPSAKMRLQQLFEAYDTSGDGTLSKEEMTVVFEQLGIKGSNYMFKKLDGNKDGKVQVHEFIAWLFQKDPKCSLSDDVTDGNGSVWATLTNTNSNVKKKFYFEFTNCENVDFSEGKTVSVVLEPGEQKKIKLLSVTGQPYRYSHEIACRSEYTGMEDASSPLRIFDFLDVGFQLGLVFFLKKNRTQNTFRSLEFGATTTWMLIWPLPRPNFRWGFNISMSMDRWPPSLHGLLEDDPNAFKDSEFPHDGRSTKGHQTEHPADVWVRARMLGDASEAVLFDQIRPQDVKQGSVGDCWLMAAIAVVAGHPELIKKLFNTNHLTEDGKYVVSMYDAGTHSWTPLVIDEFIPCKLQNGKPVPLFAKPMGEELWAVLLEKAFGKFVYSWGKLEGGDAWYAFQVMTGFKTCVAYTMRKNKWKKKTLKEDWAHGKTENARGRKINYKCFNYDYEQSGQDVNELFEELHRLGTKDYLMSCSCQGANAEAKAKGIVVWHAYSLLEVIEEVRDDGTPQRLMQVRNPWGYREWKGDWGDSSELWKQNPQLHERLKPKMAGGNDGKAFMSLEDWGISFNALTVCPTIGSHVPVAPATGEGTAEEDEAQNEGTSRQFIDSDDEADGPKTWIQW